MFFCTELYYSLQSCPPRLSIIPSLVPLRPASYPPAPPFPLQEDEDDPFYMPMMPNMVKWAEASKFSTLARPLGPEEASPFMIAMEPGVCAGGS